MPNNAEWTTLNDFSSTTIFDSCHPRFLGGYGSYFGDAFIAKEGWWWTSTKYNNDNAYARMIYEDTNGTIFDFYSTVTGLVFSVRCVKD